MRKTETSLWIALFLTATFACAEVATGLITGSLALISDAAHMSTDAAALIVSLMAMQISKRKADAKRTFGYYRFEIFAAITNAIISIIVAIYIFIHAYNRLFIKQTINSDPMLFVAILGLIINFIVIRLLNTDHQHSLNIKSAYLEAWGDLLSSVGVITAGVIIHFTGWQIVDSIIAVTIGLWILPRAWTLLKESLNILLEGVPEGLELARIYETLVKIPGVTEVHDLHVWGLTSGKISLSAHLLIDPSIKSEGLVLKTATTLLEEQFKITHSTLQIEIEKCQNDHC